MYIFISYNWTCQTNAIEVEKELSLRDGIKQEVKTIMDIKELRLFGRIPDFMEKIVTSDFAAVVICQDYLKAKNCMKEILKLYKSGDFDKKFLPLVIKGTDVISNESMIKYIEFWDKQYVDTFKMAAEFKFDEEEPIWKEVKFYKDASNLIGKIIYHIRESLHLPLIRHEKNSELTNDELNQINEKICELNKVEMKKLYDHLQV